MIENVSGGQHFVNHYRRDRRGPLCNTTRGGGVPPNSSRTLIAFVLSLHFVVYALCISWYWISAQVVSATKLYTEYRPKYLCVCQQSRDV